MKDAMKKSDDAGVAQPIRIVVADDHPVVRFGVKNMLENEPGFEVVGEAEDGDVAINQTFSCLIWRCRVCLDSKRCGRS
jgi:two-component system, NarL family, nitrate/nitrite response regulator NarL